LAAKVHNLLLISTFAAMKLIVDSKIPYIEEPLKRLADEVVLADGKEITPSLVRDADALIVRTRTKCDRRLLEGSSVKFIATATIGYDHIDTAYCAEAGITWTNAPGCNAASVAQYVESVLYLLQQEKGCILSEMTLGVVGVGHVGTLVAEVGRRLGMRVLLNDPPRATVEGEANFSPLSLLQEQCDVLSFHVPLVHDGEHPTFHLADASFFKTLKRFPFLLNTSRGEVVDTVALQQALAGRQITDAVIDVWENEPNINLDLLQRVYIGTPHIAGYSADGKANATRMSLDALCRFFHLKADYCIEPPQPEQTVIHATTLADAALQIYNPHCDSNALKAHPEQFEYLRGHYPLRRERKAYQVVMEAIR
jgi:erythronate-4-phosphate dehydrogenase